MALPQSAHLSWDEYLAVEEASDLRHELVGGVAFAMTGGTLRHSLLTGAIYSAIREAALAAGCRPHMHVMKVRLSETTSYYPDVMIVCEPPVADLYEVAPVVLAEVTSPSSLLIDRREKLGAYLTIPTLGAYLVLDQGQPSVDVHERRADGRWVARSAGPGERIVLPHPAVSLDLDDLYAGLPG